ncbi:hypothetical protein K450DRAFT_224063 [Umbelopsis ramanniana AG]|uniref:Ubiquitin-conjugating enzyme E2 1 n=1 Tax=Umbelopsis ramanniana AG TaxID=1314678 RepID=A0AAD5HIA0_UMBRA|nr:uncharacterized protein K450DRAFT_224063 [Umbelopsis ramanniana AG]KAI8583068.1 hypothetical protein K450DRAFT_224063 [Umbelopsis ramanniana AG]
MSNMKRVQKEILAIEQDKEAHIEVILPEDGSMNHMTAKISGPVNTPYEGGLFTVDVSVPPEYPFLPPKMKFVSRVYHPNISSQTGAICLDILKDKWTPVLTLKSALISLQSLLSTPEPDDPQDAQVAAHYKRDKEDFEQTAKYWTEVYANPNAEVLPDGVKPEALARLVDMGFGRSNAINALAEFKGDEQAAVESLL